MADHTSDEEYAQLHKEYQFIEKSKLESTKDSTTVLQKQQALIDKYKKDIEQLKRDNRAYLRKPRGQIAEDVLSRLSDQEFRHEKKIIKEKKKIEEYDKQIDILRDRIRTIKGGMGGINYAVDSHKMTVKQVHILENRLEKSLTRFNEALSKNRELREQIDTLRRERVVCDGIYRNMEKQLHEKENKAAKLIEDANNNYKIRDQARTDQATIEQLNNEEHVEFDKKIAEYDREEAEIAEMEEHKYDNYRTQTGDSTTTDDLNALSEYDNNNDNDIYQTPDIKMRIQSYKDSFDKIKSATGIENIDDLVEKFVSHEDQNFSLFNFVSSQTQEIEQLEESILKLKDEETKVNEDGGNDLNQHEQSQKDLKVKLEIIHSTCEKYEKDYQESLRIFNELKKSIQSIFKSIRCDELPMSELIKDEEITETNIMQFLGIIEHRSIDLLKIYNNNSNDNLTKEPPIAPKVNLESRMKITAPEIDDYNSLDLDSDEDMPRPHDIDKIKDDIYKQLATRTVIRRKSAAKKA